MVFYLLVAVLCVGALPFAWRRSGRSWTRYVVGTGTPLVLVTLLVSAAVALAVRTADPDLARELFTGGLLGSGITQFILLRRTDAQDG